MVSPVEMPNMPEGWWRAAGFGGISGPVASVPFSSAFRLLFLLEDRSSEALGPFSMSPHTPPDTPRRGPPPLDLLDWS